VLKLYVAVVLLAGASLMDAETKAMPVWLAPYPGAQAESANAVDTSYSVAARPEAVVAHYRKLITAAALPFVPNFDGMGTSIRAAATECDLLIRIRESDGGALVRVSCMGKTAGANSSLYGTDVGIASPAQALPDEKPESASAEDNKVIASEKPKPTEEGPKPTADPEPQKTSSEAPKKDAVTPAASAKN
jgi:hypothetical protein